MRKAVKKLFSKTVVALIILTMISCVTPCNAIWVSLSDLLEDYSMSDIYYMDGKPLTAEFHLSGLDNGKGGLVDGFRITRLPLYKKPDFILAPDYIDSSEPVYMDYDLDLYDLADDSDYRGSYDISSDYKDKIVYHISSSLIIPAGENEYFLDLTYLIYTLSEKYNYRGILKFTPTKTVGAMKDLPAEKHIGEMTLELNALLGVKQELHDAAMEKPGTTPIAKESTAQNKIILTLGSSKMSVDGLEVPIDPANPNTMPFSENGRTLVPIRAIIENMGGTVNWVPTQKLVEISLGGSKVELTLDQKNVSVNGKDVMLDVPARTVNGRTMVPLRFVAENLGAKVDWDGVNKTITISYTK